jgi:NADH dehydrogenase FAD-containing subunit
MQVTNVNPLRDKTNPIAGSTKIFSNIFAIGDCCLTRVNEEKTVLPAKLCADVAAENIKRLSLVNFKLKTNPKNFPCLYTISLGPLQGISIYNNYVKMNKGAAEKKIGISASLYGILQRY